MDAPCRYALGFAAMVVLWIVQSDSRFLQECQVRFDSHESWCKQKLCYCTLSIPKSEFQ